MKQLRWILACAVISLPTESALAQLQGAPVEGQGVVAGGFRLIPTLTFGTTFDDNVLLRDRRGSDVVGTVAPRVKATSTWSSNQLTVDASSQHRRYAKRSSQNNDAYRVKANGRLDITRTFPVSGAFSYGREVEERGSLGDDPDFDRYVKYQLMTGSLSASKQLNRFIVSANIGRSRYRYSDARERGMIVDQSFRDRTIDTFGGRLAYQVGPTTNVFVSGSYNEVDYARPNLGRDRSSKGATAMGGVGFELTRLLHGEVSLGYIRQEFDDPQFTDFAGLNYNATISYEPTALTSFSFGARRSLTDSAQRDVPGVMVSTFSLNMNHELLRTLILTGNVQLERRNFRGIDRSESYWLYGISARRIVNRFLSVALTYNRQERSSSGVIIGPNFRNNRVSLSMIITK
ncbi:outer membrane beta-barrel protein [Sphingomonas crocodyli]|uniref:outer membrane beta-barrel protein n=1 Tax=Sphingomonas crocodyli TaxID=1979270 RepID=UPI0013E2F524|nr:outer membrane beta-barrel protein [Sphingomonas crocodyli]